MLHKYDLWSISHIRCQSKERGDMLRNTFNFDDVPELPDYPDGYHDVQRYIQSVINIPTLLCMYHTWGCGHTCDPKCR